MKSAGEKQAGVRSGLPFNFWFWILSLGVAGTILLSASAGLSQATTELSISPTSRSHGYGSETGTVAVTAPAGLAWTAATTDSWIWILSGSSGTGNGIVQYLLTPNLAFTARRGTITIGGLIFTIDQAGLLQVVVSSVNPSTAVAGGPGFTLTIDGSGFVSGGSAISWNGVVLATTFVSSTQLTARIDPLYIAYPGVAAVSVVNSTQNGPIKSNPILFIIMMPPSPVPLVVAVSPASAVVGGPRFDLEVYGLNFVPESTVRWNGSERSTTFLSSMRLRAHIPASDIAGSGKASITVGSPDTIVSNAASFSIYVPRPMITALYPPCAIVGGSDFTLTVYGANFADGASVKWNGSSRPTTFVNNWMLRAAIPASDIAQSATSAVTVVNADGEQSDGKSFRIFAPPVGVSITGVSPEQISAGGGAFTLTVRGTGFSILSSVEWNGQSRETKYISAGELQATILAGDIAAPGIFSVTITNPLPAQQRLEAFEAGGLYGLSTVTTAVPLISKLSPVSATAGSNGFTLTIDGYGFVKGTSYVQWNSKKILPNFISNTRITVDVPSTDIALEGTINFAVCNPPPGGGTSDSQTFTITANRAPARQLYYPRLISSSGSKNENTGIAVANLGQSNAALTVSAFDTQGAQISGPGITNPVSLSISLKEQRAMTDSQIFGAGVSEQNSVGWIKLDSSEARIAGFFLVFDNDLSTLDGADVSSETVRSFVFPEIEPGQGFNQFHIANPDSASATLTFDLVGPDGQPRAPSTARTINASGAIAEYLSDLFPGTLPSASDYLRVTSTRGVVPFSYLGRAGRDSEGLNGQDASKGATVLYCPHYAVGGPDWDTTLSVVNLSNFSTTVTFQLMGDNGALIGAPVQRSIAARGKVHVSVQEFFVHAGDTLTVGYVEIRSSGGALLAGSVVFGDPQRTRYAAALPLVSTLQTSVVFGQVASGQVGSLNYYTGLALLNPWDNAAVATIELFTREGVKVASKDETLAARGRKALLLTQYFEALTGQNIGSGYIRVTADRGLASFALFGTASTVSAVPAQIVP